MCFHPSWNGACGPLDCHILSNRLLSTTFLVDFSSPPPRRYPQPSGSGEWRRAQLAVVDYVCNKNPGSLLDLIADDVASHGLDFRHGGIEAMVAFGTIAMQAEGYHMTMQKTLEDHHDSPTNNRDDEEGGKSNDNVEESTDGDVNVDGDGQWWHNLSAGSDAGFVVHDVQVDDVDLIGHEAWSLLDSSDFLCSIQSLGCDSSFMSGNTALISWPVAQSTLPLVHGTLRIRHVSCPGLHLLANPGSSSHSLLTTCSFARISNLAHLTCTRQGADAVRAHLLHTAPFPCALPQSMDMWRPQATRATCISFALNTKSTLSVPADPQHNPMPNSWPPCFTRPSSIRLSRSCQVPSCLLPAQPVLT
ncbi:hypothetical protein BCR44DRAFT_1296716 [Catenaria anguillulae PL171]|uniref:Uncharacterized protein n=1 Tax=Catenaria anguillulae PL171 TaxID=765915 RepID=A0A1Y2HVQ9_9FUNG|nr:hypothetical protein BCR44DRAFT_1296716 [Catenaria anguillulae PL171]